MKINPTPSKPFDMGLECPSSIIRPIKRVPSRLLPRIAIFPCQRRDALWFIAW